MYENNITQKPTQVRDFALTTLRVLPREIVQKGGSSYWLEPAEPLACERVMARRGSMQNKMVLRELRDGRTFNHWTHTI